MYILAFCAVILSLSSHTSSPAQLLSRITPTSHPHPSTPVSLTNEPPESKVYSLTAIKWPPYPYEINIPRRRGNQYILITPNDRLSHGLRARLLALAVCTQMIEWLRKLPQGSLIDKRHWEHQSFGDAPLAEELSVFLELKPADVHTDHDARYLDRELAYFALEEFREMVSLYGAMDGVFELHALGFRRADCAMHLFGWPLDGEADMAGKRITS